MPSLVIISNSGPATISMSYSFAWNVEQYMSVSREFLWHVGDGPLFWYRIEWGDPINPNCLPSTCISGISVCSVVPVDCECVPPPAPPCPPGESCGTCGQCEIWHVLATSVQDLCYRLNTDKCGRKLHGKVFKKILKYDRPALCCDVLSYTKPIYDRYEEVGHCVCECISWIDPCDYKCGGRFVTPCDTDVPSSLNSVQTQGLFGLPKIDVPTRPGFRLDSIKVMKPEVDSIITKCGILPSNLKLKHNLAKASVLKEFLARNKLKLDDEVELVYAKASNSWHKVIHLNGHDENWTITFSWLCSDDAGAGNYGWKSDVHVSKKTSARKQNTRVLAGFSSHGMLDGHNLFGVNFNYNTSTNKVTARQPVIVRNKTMHDEIGLFQGDWTKDPYLTLNISVK